MEKITWKADKRKVKDLKPFPNNPRRGTKDQEERLRASLEKFGTAEPLVVNTDGVVIGGNFRKSILVKMGIKEVDVMIPSRTLDEQEALELNLRLNRNTAEWDFDILSGFDENLLKEIGFDDLSESLNPLEEKNHSKSTDEPFKRCHVLVSFDLEHYEEIKETLEILKQFPFVGVEVGLN